MSKEMTVHGCTVAQKCQPFSKAAPPHQHRTVHTDTTTKPQPQHTTFRKYGVVLDALEKG